MVCILLCTFLFVLDVHRYLLPWPPINVDVVLSTKNSGVTLSRRMHSGLFNTPTSYLGYKS